MSDASTPSPAAAHPVDDRAHLVVELTRLAVEAEDVPAAVHPILDTLVARTQAVGSAYFELGGGFFRARSASGSLPEGPAMDAILAHGLPDDTPLMRALETSRDPLFFDRTTEDARAAGFPELGVTSLAAAPVRDRNDELLGAFLMHTFEPHAWTTDEAQLFSAVAGVLAGLAARLVVEERAHAAEEAAIAAREDAIRSLGLAVENRDTETKGHTDRVTDLALRIGRELDLGSEEMQALTWGAYLHDIGKIAVPDAILHKPGRLDSEEWAQMQGHSLLGHAFAERLAFLPQASLETVRHHHERWDGHGYPDALAGTAIPLLARVFAVCDVYDALTSERPYKRAWSHEDATAEILANAGSQFDPQVVQAFERVVGRAQEREVMAASA